MNMQLYITCRAITKGSANGPDEQRRNCIADVLLYPSYIAGKLKSHKRFYNLTISKFLTVERCGFY